MPQSISSSFAFGSDKSKVKPQVYTDISETVAIFHVTFAVPVNFFLKSVVSCKTENVLVNTN